MKITLYTTDAERRLEKTPETDMTLRDCDAVEEQNHPGDVEQWLINIRPELVYQTYGGIGGAFTDAAARAWRGLSAPKQAEVIRALFDPENGAGYSFGRLSIASCDFSKDDYTYVTEGDMTLDSFDISHDCESIFPMIKEAAKYTDLTLFASPWSPPAYMKTSNDRIGGHLRRDCYALWAAYFGKYIDACRANGVQIDFVTMQNEPRHHQIWESCLYTTEEESDFLGYLGKELAPRGVKILCYDHCRERAYERLRDIRGGANGAFLSGVAHHWYSGDHFEDLRVIRDRYPDMLSVASESCAGVKKEGINPESERATAEAFAHDVLGNFANGTHYYADWNLVLDEKNGPYHNRENRGAWVDALVYCDGSRDEVVYRLGYYYLTHIGRFVRPGDKVIGIGTYTNRLDACAFERADGKIVLVVLNRTDSAIPFVARIGAWSHKVVTGAHSIVTAIIDTHG